MGSNYSFNLDNYEFSRIIELLRIGSILLLISSVLAFVQASVFFSLIGNYRYAVGITVWIVDLTCVLLEIPAFFLLLYAIDVFSQNLDNENFRRTKIIKILLVVYLFIYFIFSLVVLILFHTPIGNTGKIIVAKNLILLPILAVTLIFCSLLFNNLQKIGYGTRLLITPLILMPLPSIMGFIIGIIILTSEEAFNSTFDTLETTTIFCYLFITLMLTAAFTEFFFSIRKLSKKAKEIIEPMSNNSKTIRT
ncbi:MAG TPA: hypothetical protein VMX55_05410 [candidate division Zixibacteria bacterium]|nr:hypothetical protein [candidate division Zixibacteria bacterium]